jgi:hypothetical protein
MRGRKILEKGWKKGRRKKERQGGRREKEKQEERVAIRILSLMFAGYC